MYDDKITRMEREYLPMVQHGDKFNSNNNTYN